MTDLTQDYKDGKLSTGMYYVKYKDGRYGRANLILTPDFYVFFRNVKNAGYFHGDGVVCGG